MAVIAVTSTYRREQLSEADAIVSSLTAVNISIALTAEILVIVENSL